MIAFVVPAHNEEALLGACLDSIARAMREVAPRDDFEIVVANDASTDRTGDIARARGAVVIDVTLRHIAAVRNAGARAISPRCERLIFLDADTVLTSGALAGTLAAFASGAVGGGARFVSDGRLPLLAKLTFNFFTALWFSLRLAAGCYVFARRQDFEAVGGFDERVYAGEEYFISRALKRRGRFVIVDQPVVTSARKLRTYTPLQLVGFLIKLVARGERGIQSRKGLELWYEAKREPPHEPKGPAA